MLSINEFDLGVRVGNTFKLSERVEEILDSVSAKLSGEDKTRRAFRRLLAAHNFTQNNLLPTLLEIASPENEGELNHLFSKVLR
jgi:hypothetical protein